MARHGADGDRLASRPRRGCCFGCLGAATLIAAVLCFTVWLGSRPPDDVVVPTPPMPAVNGYDDVKRACDMLKGRTHLFPASMPNYSPATYTLRDYEAAYREAASAFAALRPALRKPYQNPPCRSFSSFDRGYADIREMARSLSGAAEYKAKIGREGEALDLLLDGEELGVTMPRCGSMLPELVGKAVEAISTFGVESLLPRLTANDLRHAADRLERIAAKRVPYSDTIREEGWMSVAGDKEALAGLSPTAPGKYYDTVSALTGSSGGHPTAADMLRLARFTLGSKSTMLRRKLAYFEAASRDVSGAYRGKCQVPLPDDPLCEGVGDLVSQGWERHAGRQSVIDILRVEVALLRYRAEHGRYPDGLGSLAPRYMKAVPDDVCAGKPGTPLHYQADPDGRSYVLYGVGPDRRDDGGQPAWRFSGPGDIVAGHLNGR